jgi:hypothetical protein
MDGFPTVRTDDPVAALCVLNVDFEQRGRHAYRIGRHAHDAFDHVPYAATLATLQLHS